LVLDEFQKLTNTTIDMISSIAKETTNAMDITASTLLNQTTLAVELAIKGQDFKITQHKRMDITTPRHT
jgi:hypothetical protein